MRQIINKIPDMDLASETMRGGFYIDTVRHPKSGFFIMEIWRDIEGFMGYMVSNHGRVKSLAKPNRGRGSTYKDKILCKRTRRHGYYVAALYKDSKQHNESVHRLVAKAFIDDPNNYNEVNHKDGDKQNNHVSNLEWCTHSHNLKHSFEIGTNISCKGSQMHNAKLNEEMVKDIREIYSKGKIGVRPLARKYGVSKTTMQHALHGKTWKHI